MRRGKWPQSLTVHRKPLIKCVISAVLFMVGYVALMLWRTGQMLVMEGLFLAGLLMVIIGCWYAVRWLGLFDLTVYGFKRFAHGVMKRHADDSPMPSYVEYLEQPRAIPSAGEPLLCGAVLIVLYCLLVYAL